MFAADTSNFMIESGMFQTERGFG